ncbi:MAG: hypothetical protein Q4G64_06965 [bacterium]|nr:hypothetical protein [bacterium]
MDEWVLDEAAALGAISRADGSVEDAQAHITGLPGEFSGVPSSVTASRVAGPLREWFQSQVQPALQVASVRADNATGGAREVVTILEQADQAMAAEAEAEANQLVWDAMEHATRGMSQE